MKFDYQERIDNYVQGEMTADERNAFEEELKANDELREQVEYTQKVKSLVSDREEKMRALREWIHEDDEEEMMVASARNVMLLMNVQERLPQLLIIRKNENCGSGCLVLLQFL